MGEARSPGGSVDFSVDDGDSLTSASEVVDHADARRFTLAPGSTEELRDDGTVEITSDVSGEVLLELEAHEGKAVRSLAVSTDGTRMASGGADNKVRVWDTATGKCEQILEGHSSEVLGVAFPKEDCDLVASCSSGERSTSNLLFCT